MMSLSLMSLRIKAIDMNLRQTSEFNGGQLKVARLYTEPHRTG